MPEALSIGPLLLSTRVFGFLMAAVMAVWLVHWAALFLKVDAVAARKIAEHGIWIGIITSRAVYVAGNWTAYAEQPWTAFYLWQPGYSPVAGTAAALMYILYRIYVHNSSLRPSLAAALCAGFTLPALLYAGLLITMNRFVGAAFLVPGDTVPNYELIDLDGRSVGFEDLRGQGIVMNFWATWCAPCRREMPLLESVYQEYRDQGVVIVGISVGESRETAQRYIDTIGVTYPIWGDRIRPDDNTDEIIVLSERFKVIGLPTTFFIDRNGTIRSGYVGELNQAILKERIPDLLPAEGGPNPNSKVSPTG